MVLDLSHLDVSLYQNKKVFPQEIVYEITQPKNNLPWGLAIADIAESQLHVHKKTFETYIVLEGDLKVFLGKKEVLLHPKDRISIPIGIPHKAKSLNSTPARVLVICFPEFSQDDYFPL